MVEELNRKKAELPRSVLDRLAFLRAGKDNHYELLKEILQADGANLFHVDLVVIAAMQRSMALIDGFARLVEDRNALAAVPLIRLQIDSIIRLYSCWLVDSPPDVAKALLDDMPLNRIKSKDGKPLTDRALYEAASEHYPWIPEVYKQTSGFVHLSIRHITAPMVSADETGFSMRLGEGGGREWSEQEMVEAVEAFVEATKCLLHLCWSWLETKKLGRGPWPETIPAG